MKTKTLTNTFLTSAVISVLCCASCKETSKSAPIKPVEVHFTKEAELSIFKAKTDSVIQTLDIEIADTDYDRETGLMYRTSMLDSQGMLFVFPDETRRSFYMKNTQFALDLIYIKADRTIDSFQKYAKPMDEASLLSEGGAMYVLEVNAGLSDAWNLKAGDSISFSEFNN
ncbi:DUF192 domain-containing protein [Formosa sp. A9]|uniref:DUF192 domain-containing protein n=1 Tax=Formosa sp. A9 TaxID=3442641 RepID=UPI003EC11F13